MTSLSFRIALYLTASLCIRLDDDAAERVGNEPLGVGASLAALRFHFRRRILVHYCLFRRSRFCTPLLLFPPLLSISPGILSLALRPDPSLTIPPFLTFSPSPSIFMFLVPPPSPFLTHLLL